MVSPVDFDIAHHFKDSKLVSAMGLKVISLLISQVSMANGNLMSSMGIKIVLLLIPQASMANCIVIIKGINFSWRTTI